MEMTVFLKRLMTNMRLIFVRGVIIINIYSDCSLQCDATKIMNVVSSSYKI